MWDMDSYRDFLQEHAGNHHAIGSALALLVAAGILLFVFA
jgi:hypothetical protein